ncbi:MAG: agmatinase family protein [Saprospiraceae bacterium]
MSKKHKIANFDPSGVGLKNGHFIGLPFEEEDADIILLPVPWDVTVSYSDGTATGAQNILEASPQIDLFDSDVENAWMTGIYMRHLDLHWTNRNGELRPLAGAYIDFLENGGNLATNSQMAAVLEEINSACGILKTWVFEQTTALLKQGKMAGIVGGEHSVPLGYLEALAQHRGEFGILQIDAHQDLRPAYEGFQYSHASIFYNALKIKELTKLVQVGVRDYCEQEVELTAASNGRVHVWTDQHLREQQFAGHTFAQLCKQIIALLPEKVYISFDIDGLVPGLCPNTGTPVPGGLHFQEAMFLLKTMVESGRKIIGFDLCEVAGVGNEWDGNVGARVLYKLCNFMAKSAGLNNEE